jgi:endonuclease/exonuclease/phosphatase (EEP) superfamily protein YafD
MWIKKGRTFHRFVVFLLTLLAYVYFICLYGWVIWHTIFGDHWGWLFLLNSLAVYLFLPLPGVLLIGLWMRRREIWLGSGVTLALGVYLYGGLFLPKLPPAQADGKTLTIMTYNSLGFNEQPEAVVAAIRAARADVVALQELNPAVAEAIQRQLTSKYPYQTLKPQPGITGLGVISRYPLHPIGQTLPGAWIGPPQILTMNFEGTVVTLINFHSVSVNFEGWDFRAKVEQAARERERQAQTLAHVAAVQPGPLIVLGDFNASEQSTAYRLVTSVLTDAWREAGYGLGHTFPGADSPGSARPVIAGIPVPMWLVRIDYIFYSNHWQAASAWLGPWDGVSDHRPVVARLILVDR